MTMSECGLDPVCHLPFAPDPKCSRSNLPCPPAPDHITAGYVPFMADKLERTTLHPMRTKRNRLFPAITMSLAMAFAASAYADNDGEGWTELFNGKDLKGWTACLGRDGDENSQKTDEIFSVRDGVIHIYQGAEVGSKQSSANLYHESTWSSFRLQVEYRWLDRKFQPRNRGRSRRRHPFPRPHRAGEGLAAIARDADGRWENRLPICLGRPLCHRQHPLRLALRRGEIRCGRTHGHARGRGGRNPRRRHGEWNLAEVVVHGSEKAEFYLNGKLLNVIRNMKFEDADGEWKPLEKGHISIHAEWAELEYRAIRIKEIEG